MDPTLTRAEALSNAMTTLGELLRQEIELISSRNYASLPGLAERKQLLTRAFDEASKALKVDREGFAKLEPEVRDRLRAESEGFRVTVQRNVEAVRSASQAAQKVVDTLVRTLNQDRAQDATYTVRNGRPMSGAYGRRGVAPSTVNQTL